MSEVTAPPYGQMGRTCCQHLPDPLYAQLVDIGGTFTLPSPNFDCDGSCYNDVKNWNGGSDVITMARYFTPTPFSPTVWLGTFQGACANSPYPLVNLFLRCTDNPNFPYVRRFSLTLAGSGFYTDYAVYGPDATSTDVPFLLIFPSITVQMRTGVPCLLGVRITDTHP